MASYERMTERYAVVATIDPQQLQTTGGTSSTTAAWTDAIDMDVFEQVRAILMTNTVAASTGINFVLYSDEASATGGMTTTVLSATQLTAGDDNAQVVLEARNEDITSGHRYVRAKVTVLPTTSTTGTATIAVIAEAGPSRYGPATDDDLASVSEIKYS